MMVKPYPAYHNLHEIYALLQREPERLSYLSGQYLTDLLTWYHLAWTGETVRRAHEIVPRLMARGSNFTYADRLALFSLIGEIIQGIIPRYRRLQQAGTIELSTTPHYHPIVPLLLDFNCARDALPAIRLPAAASYPGGAQRAEYHVRSAIESHTRRFSAAPAGVWPAEGGLSSATGSLFAAAGCTWTASGEGVLTNTLRQMLGPDAMPERSRYLYRPFPLAAGGRALHCFFRDERLSDRIGFEYAKWFGRDAVANLVHSFEDIWREASDDEDRVVSVILDGENAWEFFPYNGYFFLSELYDALQDHPHIRMTTFADFLKTMPSPQAGGTIGAARKADSSQLPRELPSLISGSWVYADFSTWIGDPDKNRAWDLLCAAKIEFDRVMASGQLDDQEKASAARQLASCEASDWFWWFGDIHPARNVASFDRLFRHALSNLYRVLKLPIPAQLSDPVSLGASAPQDTYGAMRRAT
jgi:alpha-amylase/alpha-mannosidase (GH57 family)